MSAARLEEHIRYLASDRLAGRGTGTPGYDSAAHYVAKHFAMLGLDSAGTEGYFQPVPLRRARAVEGSGLVLIGKAGRRALVPYRDYVPFPNLLAPRSEVTAPLVFAGFGVTAPERGYDDYREVDAKGKIVVLLTGAPPPFRRPSGRTTPTVGRSGRTRSAGARSASWWSEPATRRSPGTGWCGSLAAARCAGSIGTARPPTSGRPSGAPECFRTARRRNSSKARRSR